MNEDINVKLKFTAKFFDGEAERNYFRHLPQDLKSFLAYDGGMMESIVGNLHPDKYYEIKISIKEVKEPQ